MGKNKGKAPGEFVAQGQPVPAQGTPVQPVQHSSVSVTVASALGNSLPAKEQAHTAARPSNRRAPHASRPRNRRQRITSTWCKSKYRGTGSL